MLGGNSNEMGGYQLDKTSHLRWLRSEAVASSNVYLAGVEFCFFNGEVHILKRMCWQVVMMGWMTSAFRYLASLFRPSTCSE